MLTRTAPILAVANCTITRATQLVDQIPRRQTPSRSSARFRRRRACFGFLGRRFLLLCEIELEAQISSLAPTAIEMEPAAVVGNEWKPKAFVTAHCPVPTTIGIADFLGKTSDARERFVRDAHDVERKIVTGIAQVPHEIPAALARTIPIRRDRLVCVSEPRDRVQFFPGAVAAGQTRVVGQHFARTASG